jgi:DNA primase
MKHVSQVKEYQRRLLMTPKCVSYLTSRAVTLASIIEFGLGYFDYNEWDRYYDRLLFPIYGLDGDLVSFQARALFDWKEQGLPKYYHGSYDKSKTLYGLWHTAPLIVEKGYAVLVEGPMDVISLWQAGIPAVSGLGTAFSESQACILRMYTDRVVMWLDNDAAGSKATEQVAKTLQGVTFETFNVGTSAKDPSDLLVDQGVAALRLAVGHSVVYK